MFGNGLNNWQCPSLHCHTPSAPPTPGCSLPYTEAQALSSLHHPLQHCSAVGNTVSGGGALTLYMCVVCVCGVCGVCMWCVYMVCGVCVVCMRVCVCVCVSVVCACVWSQYVFVCVVQCEQVRISSMLK